MSEGIVDEPPVRSGQGLLARLTRRTSTGRYIPEVDGLRFVCIGLVLALHVQQAVAVRAGVASMAYPFGGVSLPAPNDPIGWFVAQGALGVYIFFVISGFVLGLPFALRALAGGPRIDLPHYYLRRLTRIEPPYFVVMTLLFLLTGVSTAHYLAGILYVHNLVFSNVNPLNGPAWTLEIEIQFYVAVPLLATVFSMHRRRPRMVMLGLVGVVLGALLNHLGPTTMTMLGAMTFFMAGFLVADLYVTDWQQRPERAWRWDVIGLAGWVLLFAAWGTRDARITNLAAPIAAFAIFCSIFRGPVSNRALTTPWVRTLGGMCYSIYLVNVPIVFTVARMVSGWLIVVLAVPLSLAAGIAFHVLVERPCMNPAWPRRLRSWASAPATRWRVSGRGRASILPLGGAVETEATGRAGGQPAPSAVEI